MYHNLFDGCENVKKIRITVLRPEFSKIYLKAAEKCGHESSIQEDKWYIVLRNRNEDIPELN